MYRWGESIWLAALIQQEISMTKTSSVSAMAAVAGVMLALLAGAGSAQARDVHWSVGIGVPGVVIGGSNGYPVYSPAPVYMAPPPPVYYAPPRPIYYAPPPAYYGPPAVYYGGHGYRYGHRHHGHRHHWNGRHGGRDRDRDDD